MNNILLIGGGPSITPEILDCLNNYNNCIKFGCNVAYNYINDLDYLGFIDMGFYKKHINKIIKQKDIQNFKIISSQDQKHVDIKIPVTVKNQKRTRERNNTGSYLLKYILDNYNNSNIYLFGFDMCMEDNQKNFHDDYKDDTRFNTRQKNGHINGHFLYISRLIKNNKTDNIIYSCSKISRLNTLLKYQLPDHFSADKT